MFADVFAIALQAVAEARQEAGSGMGWGTPEAKKSSRAKVKRLRPRKGDRIPVPVDLKVQAAKPRANQVSVCDGVLKLHIINRATSCT